MSRLIVTLFVISGPLVLLLMAMSKLMEMSEVLGTLAR